MASVVDICNLALGHLGDEGTVSSIDPPSGSAEADHCARFYPIARDQLLGCGHAWSFATKRIALAALVTTEIPDSWTYAYALPSAFLNAISVLSPGVADDNDTEDFIIEALQDGTPVVFTNVEDATLRYVYSITDTTKFSALFVTACARLLASYLAGPMIKGTEGMKVASAQLQIFVKLEYPAATAVDARGRKQNKYKDFIPDSLKARG